MTMPYAKLFGQWQALAEALVDGSAIVEYDSIKRGRDKILLTVHPDFWQYSYDDLENAARKGLLLAYNLEKGRPANIKLASIVGWTLNEKFSD